MATHDINLLRRFRFECVAKANKNIKAYTKKNKKVLTQLITKAVNDLKRRDPKAIQESSYKLYSAAATFDRPDISNLSDLLKRMVKNPALASSDEVLLAFEEALITFSSFERAKPDQEKKILDALYKVLRKHSM